METLASQGIYVGVTMMPILPFIEDNESNFTGIMRRAALSGARYVIPSFGTTMREGSREPYYAALDDHFPGLRHRYENHYGDRYDCTSPNHRSLSMLFKDLCRLYNLTPQIEHYSGNLTTEQLPLF